MGYQADVTVTSLASFALVMAAEVFEMSAAKSFPPEISNSLLSFRMVYVYLVEMLCWRQLQLPVCVIHHTLL